MNRVLLTILLGISLSVSAQGHLQRGAVDETGKPYYLVKNSWGESGQYKGIWYMSRDYIALNTTYLFLNRHALPQRLRHETQR